ncbi:Purine catabolism regulatory protein [Mycobacterium marinum]|uniref:PucR family transcriptional regulator n=1 Tax=Mycobacterium marinum TaxID=1781 RepID=UPI000EDEA85C|nr:PucR family transcriptional regulator [Mycobacterium marinum]RFZ14988.1 Purine catabolism regulatory protein [Mycobacterium marinum]
MEPRWPPFQEPSARRVWHQVLRPVAAEMQTCATQLARDIVDRYQCELPSIVPDPPAVAEQLASVEASVRQIAECIDSGEGPRLLDLTPATAAIGRSGVQRNIALNDLFRSVRMAQERTWQWLFDRITASSAAADHDRALDLATNWLFGYVDVVLIRAERLYEVEREAWLTGAAAARAAAVEDILTEREDDAQRASTRLRYDVNRHHVGVSVWRDVTQDACAGQVTLTQALTQLTRAIAAQSVLAHPAGSKAIAGWLSRPQAFTAAELDVANIGSGIHLPQDVRVAIGEPGWGISGFRRTHVEASHAQRFVSLLGDRAEVVTCYRNVAVAALAGTDRGHAVAFVRRVLGPLAANDEGTYRIATTLAVYLEENRSPAKAAQRLGVHPNTVSYRVHQAEELLGRTIDIGTLDLSVALALLPAMRAMTQGSGGDL